jgi:choline dehydrogenase-like flavoprotein
MSYIVIGSGPAGVAAAKALAEAGRSVTVVDAGDTIEAGRMSIFDALAQSEPQAWSPELVKRARGAFPVTSKHVPLKPAYGSLFPYALDDADLPVLRENAETLPSLALGGLSNAWGASMLPFSERDIDGWPIRLAELAPHYEAVLRFVPLAAEHDELSGSLPLYTDSPHKLERGPQAHLALRHMRRHAAGLTGAGFAFGASRLALATAEDDENRCRYSGMCLYGCPYHSIYNASQTLAELVRDDGVRYHGGVYADRLSITDGSVTVDVHERGRPQARGQLTGSRVFIACGALSSTRLMLTSMGAPQMPRRLLDSQYFLIPMVLRGSAPVSVETQGNTLAQVYIELDDQRVSKRGVHMQLYGYNDLMLSLLSARLPGGSERWERVLRPLLGRLVILQGYLHSEDSPGMTLELESDGIRVVGDDGASAAVRVKRLARHLAVNARHLGMAPIPYLTQVGRPGQGNHIGGSFPMRREPGTLDTDRLGRLPGWDRVHLIDASVLPSVPATTVTLSVMANAHRIATAAGALED